MIVAALLEHTQNVCCLAANIIYNYVDRLYSITYYRQHCHKNGNVLCCLYSQYVPNVYTAAVTYAATADHNNDSGTNLTSLTTGVTVAEPIALKTHSPVSKKGSNTSTGSSGYGSNRDSKISATSSRGSLISTYSTSVIPEESSCYCVESPMAKDHTKEEHLGAKPESPICLGTDTNPMRGRSSAFYRTKDKGRTEETEKIEKSRLKAYLKHMN